MTTDADKKIPRQQRHGSRIEDQTSAWPHYIDRPAVARMQSKKQRAATVLAVLPGHRIQSRCEKTFTVMLNAARASGCKWKASKRASVSGDPGNDRFALPLLPSPCSVRMGLWRSPASCDSCVDAQPSALGTPQRRSPPFRPASTSSICPCVPSRRHCCRGMLLGLSEGCASPHISLPAIFPQSTHVLACPFRACITRGSSAWHAFNITNGE